MLFIEREPSSRSSPPCAFDQEQRTVARHIAQRQDYRHNRLATGKLAKSSKVPQSGDQKDLHHFTQYSWYYDQASLPCSLANTKATRNVVGITNMHFASLNASWGIPVSSTLMISSSTEAAEFSRFSMLVCSPAALLVSAAAGEALSARGRLMARILRSCGRSSLRRPSRIPR
jgi:hypothetical protein